MNCQKSGVFNTNVQHTDNEALSVILGVRTDLCEGKYLRLPSLMDHLEKKVHGFVKDKVWKRVQGWQIKPIS